jgi:acyl dehydratase
VKTEKRVSAMALREFDSVKVGDQLPEKVIPLTRGDLVNYAGVSGDLNPIHWDDEIAKQVGLDTAIAHGMLTMGLGGGYVTSWIGDPAAVTEYNVRFTAVVPVPNDGVGAEIVFNGRVKSVEPETKSITIALTATSGGKKIFGRAVATAKLA